MAQVTFTTNLRRHREVRSAEAEGATVREVLDRVFGADPLLRSYILDDQGRLRRHVNVFVGGRPIADRRALSDPVGAKDEIYVLQALSGG
jgi:sulfur-carrier protein